LDAARRTLDDVLTQLPEGIVIGIENRSDYHEIPNLSELQQLLDEYGDAVGYWHDVGHAYMQELAGFYEKDAYIKTLQCRLIGAHIHDALGFSDHRAPGYGEIDFESSLKPYLNDGVLRVLELHSRVTPEEAAYGIQFLRTMNII
jgi:sugar phosphate isomerase/epimerase